MTANAATLSANSDQPATSQWLSWLLVGALIYLLLAAIGAIGDGFKLSTGSNAKEFHRAFSAATVHDAFNIVAVAILLQLELLFSPLQRTAEALAGFFVSDASVDMKSVNFMKVLLSPAADVLNASVSWIPGNVWSGVVLIVIGIALILFVVSAIGKVLRKVMVGLAKNMMHKSVGRGPLSGMASGAIITVLVQSSSTTTSLIVPLAGTGVFNLKQISMSTASQN